MMKGQQMPLLSLLQNLLRLNLHMVLLHLGLDIDLLPFMLMVYQSGQLPMAVRLQLLLSLPLRA
jgi:hypothetical protein|uniref:Uncharacterized protein n=1 Tax=Picea glauca TaxID=3330 RepID=A0A101M2M1_PICGL|nr:hypothetical protein ABT39_MTgene3006 [Picea glauca]QHR91905.1 hypothetical protein Q903MT_gene5941 [Picea sitchensis]